jgi:hypothetical protein
MRDANEIRFLHKKVRREDLLRLRRWLGERRDPAPLRLIRAIRLKKPLTPRSPDRSEFT